ncbi:hypothetical protein PG996_010705 [Apiospora saccharicola]|uniref:Uncharacterized protein n=1 Tax=Apiospora saccharicola TaxID=335842 RepID=A0ABR1UPB3_9PEZI
MVESETDRIDGYEDRVQRLRDIQVPEQEDRVNDLQAAFLRLAYAVVVALGAFFDFLRLALRRLGNRDQG